jgi:hypothetical protein
MMLLQKYALCRTAAFCFSLPHRLAPIAWLWLPAVAKRSWRNSFALYIADVRELQLLAGSRHAASRAPSPPGA